MIVTIKHIEQSSYCDYFMCFVLLDGFKLDCVSESPFERSVFCSENNIFKMR